MPQGKARNTATPSEKFWECVNDYFSCYADRAIPSRWFKGHEGVDVFLRLIIIVVLAILAIKKYLPYCISVSFNIWAIFDILIFHTAVAFRGQRGATGVEGEHFAGAIVDSQFSIAAPVDRDLDLTGRFVRGEVES